MDFPSYRSSSGTQKWFLFPTDWSFLLSHRQYAQLCVHLRSALRPLVGLSVGTADLWLMASAERAWQAESQDYAVQKPIWKQPVQRQHAPGGGAGGVSRPRGLGGERVDNRPRDDLRWTAALRVLGQRPNVGFEGLTVAFSPF